MYLSGNPVVPFFFFLKRTKSIDAVIRQTRRHTPYRPRHHRHVVDTNSRTIPAVIETPEARTIRTIGLWPYRRFVYNLVNITASMEVIEKMNEIINLDRKYLSLRDLRS